MKKLILILFLFVLSQPIFAQKKQTVAIIISSNTEKAKVLIRSYLTEEVLKLNGIQLVSQQQKPIFFIKINAIQGSNEYFFSSIITKKISVKNRVIEQFMTDSLYVTPENGIQVSCKSIVSEFKDKFETSNLLERMRRITGQ